MNKEELLKEIAQATARGEITRGELLEAFDKAKEATHDHEQRSNLSVLFYYIGVLILYVGIYVLLFQYWDFLAMRALIGLAGGITAFVIAMIYEHTEEKLSPAPAFFLLSALLLPIGIASLEEYTGYKPGEVDAQVINAAFLFFLFLFAFTLRKQLVLLILSILSSSWLFYSLIVMITNTFNPSSTELVLRYATQILGIAYILLGSALIRTIHQPISGFLHTFGTLFLLGGTFAHALTSPEFAISIWDSIFPFLCILMMILGLYLQIRAFLIIGALFLVTSLIYLTVKFFKDDISWATLLMLAGILIILIGRFLFFANKKYFFFANKKYFEKT